MKLNAITYQDGKPSFNQINAPTNSNYAIGIKVNDKDGEEIPLSAPDIKLVDGEPVVVSQYRSTVQGPNFVYCFDMIRDFAKEYEGEDLIKQIT